MKLKQIIFLQLCTTYYVLSSRAPLARAAITNTAIPGGESPDSAPQQFAITMATLWQTIIIVGGLAFLLYFLWGGLNWILAGGDKGKLDESRAKITQGLIGLAVLAASYVVVKFIESAIGLDLLNIIWPTAG
ncbi:MAG: hypothetical protein DPW11_02460 [bacterium]|nr:hypothetical protein [Candidatus Microgenomates bacterium CPR3]MCQ3944614.1 hypothetical protein [bacterium]RIK52222.1 MAG: hypothetical protein DCC61_00335 [Candidatus Microgenomates bacterium]